MGNLAFVTNAIDARLKDLHCGYIGVVLWTDGETATVQPLGLTKAYGGTAMKQAVVSDVPVGCKYKFTTKTITYCVDAEGNTESQKIAVPKLIEKGDLVAVLCADRDITGARQGINELPAAGMHSISDSIIVGILSDSSGDGDVSVYSAALGTAILGKMKLGES